ncbi:MAG: hypothetical protein R3C16_02755 [Hyphomonadaceae bacterium]
MALDLIYPTPVPTAPMRDDEPPAADAPYEERAAWSERYVKWYITHAPQEGPTPIDVSPTHRYEVEFNTCVLNPRAYARDTHEELAAYILQ